AYGVFTWKMDGMGTISLEEIKVSTIISKKQFEIKMKSDEIYFGSFDASSQGGTVFIVTLEEKKLVTISDIVEIYPMKSNVKLRMIRFFSDHMMLPVREEQCLL